MSLINFLLFIFTNCMLLSPVELSKLERKGLLKNFLVVTDYGHSQVWQFDLHGKDHVLIANLSSPVAVDVNGVTEEIFIADETKNAIYKVPYNGTTLELIKIKTILSDLRVSGLALDANAGLLFYTIYGENSVILFDLNTKKEKTIVRKNDLGPKSIRCDTIDRKIYWVNVNQKGGSLIKYADYNGKNVGEIAASHSFNELNSLFINVKDRTLYWTMANKIFSLNISMSMSNISLTYFASEKNQLYGIAVGDRNIYFSGRTFDTVMKKGINDNFTSSFVPERKLLNPKEMVIFLEPVNLDESGSLCDSNNGDCSEICLPKENSVECLCSEEKRLLKNEKSCSKENHYNGPKLIFTTFDGDSTSHIYFSEDFKNETLIKKFQFWDFQAMSYDYERSSLYLIDRDYKYVTRLNLMDKNIDVLHFGISREVYGLAYDWINDNILWTDKRKNWIQMQSLKNRKLLKTLFDHLDEPHSIVVHPAKGYIFWSDWGVTKTLHMGSLDGLEKKVFKYVESKVVALTIDYKNNKLFYATEQKIFSISTEGTDFKEEKRIDRSNFISLAVHSTYLFAALQTDSGIGKIQTYEIGNFMSNSRNILLNKITSVIMYDDSQKKNDTIIEKCESLKCSDFCVSHSSEIAVCACSDFKKLTKNRDCRYEARVENSFVYAISNSSSSRVCSIPTRAVTAPVKSPNNFCFFHQKTHDYRGFAYDFFSGDLYFSAVKTSLSRIYRANMRHRSDNSVVFYGTRHVEDIEIDFMRNLYFTDMSSHAIWVTHLDKKLLKRLLMNLNYPRYIAIDDKRKKLYWTEGGFNRDDGKIMQANLDGSSKTEFWAKNTDKIESLALDNDRLYWSNAKQIFSFTIEKLNFKNYNIPSQFPPKSISIYRDFMAINPKNDSALIMISLPEHGTDAFKTQVVKHDKFSQSSGVVAIHNKYVEYEFKDEMDICNLKKCEQFCFFVERTPKCSCIDGMELEKDTTCRPTKIMKDQFFLVADDYKHQIYQIDKDMKEFSTFRMPIGSRPIGVDFDIKFNKVYWSDFGLGHNGAIYRSDLEGKNVELVLKPSPNETTRIDSLSIDYQARQLYYTDQGKDAWNKRKNSVGIINIDSLQHNKNFIKLTGRPRAVVVIPEKGSLYLTERDSKENGTSIQQFATNGSYIDEITSEDMEWPMGLTYNRLTDEIFWCDAHSEKIYKSKFGDNNTITEIFKGKANENPFDLEIQGDYLYWTDWGSQGLRQLNLKTKKFSILFENLFNGLNEIKYFDRKVMTGKTDPCRSNPCSSFCFSKGESYTCGCPEGSIIGPDKKSCINKCPKIHFNGKIHIDCDYKPLSICYFECKTPSINTTLNKVQCNEDLTWSKDLKKTCNISKPKPQKSHKSSTINVGVIVAIVFVILISIILLLIGVIFMRRRFVNKSIPYGQQIDEPTPETNSTISVPVTSYNAKTDSVNLNDKIAFENPLYATLPEGHEIKAETSKYNI